MDDPDVIIICTRLPDPAAVPGEIRNCAKCDSLVHVAFSSFARMKISLKAGGTATLICGECFRADPPKELALEMPTKAQMIEMRDHFEGGERN